MAHVNSINNATSKLTIDPGASGNSFVQFNVNASSKFIVGIDDSASDVFKISQGSALGTNDTFIMNSSGVPRMPLQAAFLGYLPSTDTNATGDTTQYTLGGTTALTKVFDQGTNFTTAGVFTAPVTGRYHLSGMIYLGALTSSNNLATIDIVTTATIYDINFNCSSVISSGKLSIGINTMASMTAGDTAFVRTRAEGTSKVVSVLGGANANSSFSGYLVC